MSELITIAAFDLAMNAHLARTILEEEGIEVFIADEFTVTANPFYTGFVGGIKVQVSEEDAPRAVAILKEKPIGKNSMIADLPKEKPPVKDPGSHEDMVSESDRHCPECHSTDVTYERLPMGKIFLTILLLGFPLPFFNKRPWECGRCGHRWREETTGPR